MNGRLKVIGVMLAVIGLAFIAGGGFALLQDGPGSQVAAGIQRGAERHTQLQRSRDSSSTAARPKAPRRSCRS